eukprot:1852283-Pyramimonas_sp.AAC.1
MLTPSKVQSESETPSKVLIAEEERDRLAEMVHGARSSAMPGPYAAFNTSLKDSAAIPCSVEAMCVKHLQALIRTPPSKAHKCRPGALLARCWSALGRSWGPSWGPFGPLLGLSWT